MRRLLVICAATAAVVVVFAAVSASAATPSSKADDSQYTTHFDSIDLEQILSSRRLVKNYVDCLMGRKGCPPAAAELKRVLPEALATRCAKCSPLQRESALHTVKLLRQRYPDMWAELQRKWDPTGEHVRRLEAAEARLAAGEATKPATAT